MADGRGGWLFASLSGFSPSWLAGDAVAALTLAAIAIPEQLATARLVGLPPETGLFAFAAGSLAFAAFGTNRFLSVGADSTIAPIMAAALAGLAATGSGAYAGLAATLAVLVGILLLLTGPLRLGWIADLLSIPVTTGFLAGISVHIIVDQLHTLLGLPVPAGSLIAQLVAIVGELARANPYSAGIGLGVLALCLVTERLKKHVPGALIGLILSGIAVWQFGLNRHGVSVLGALPVAFPSVTLALPSWSAFTHLLPLALIVALVCMMQTAAVLQSFSSGPGWGGDASRDFAAVGAGCILAALLGSFAVDSSPPRTAVVAESGGRSQLAGLFAVVLVGLLVVVAAPAFAFVPHAALGGVLVFIGIRIFHVRQMRRIYRKSPREILLVAASAALVIGLPIDLGVSLSIVLSLLHSIYVIARPHCAELARIPGTTIWWTLGHEAGEHEPGVLVFGPGAPLNFMNANYLLGRLMEAIAAKAPPCRLVVIEAHGVIDIDFTGSQLLQQAVGELRRRGIDVAVARLESERAERAASRTGLIEALGADHVFRSVDEAIRGRRPRLAGDAEGSR